MNENFLKNVLTTSVDSQHKLQMTTEKIRLIANAIAARFNADGIDDISFEKKVTFWNIVANAGAIAKLIREIINIIKAPVPVLEINSDALLEQSKLAEQLFIQNTDQQN